MMGITARAEQRVWHPAPTALVGCAAAAVSVACTVAALVLHRGVDGPALQSGDIVVATVFPLVAALILAHQPRNLVGWLLLSCATMGVYLLAGQYAARTVSDPGPLTGVAGWYSIWGFFPYFVLWTLAPMHFPDGVLPSGRWRRVRAGLVALLGILVAARMVAPVGSDASSRIENPLEISGAQWLNVVTMASALSLLVLGGLTGVVAVVVRSRRTHGVERRRMTWLLAGVGWLMVANLANLAVEGASGGTGLGFALGMAGLVLCLGVGVIRHQLFDVREGLRRSIANAVLFVLLAGAAVAVLAATGAGGQPERLGLVAIAVVLLLVAAARDQLQHLVDLVVFGQRQGPAGVLSTLRRRLDLATGPGDALGQLAQGVCETLRVPYARIEPTAGHLPPIVAGADPPAPADGARFAAVDTGETLGHLVVGRRVDGSFSRRDRRALELVADRVGALLRQAELSAEVRAQREQLVVAREDERRRLRRDLHDGVGPALAGIAMQLDRLAARLGDQPDLAGRAASARDDLRRTVGSVRRIVDGLRPAALDEIGLAAALAQLVDPYDGRVQVRCAPMPDLPAATTAAAYLLTGEAVTNAMRHSGCTTCHVDVRPDPPWLVVTVTDDGTGIPEAAPRGVGLTSMRDRAAEIGGLLEVTTSPGETLVRAHLPIDPGATQ